MRLLENLKAPMWLAPSVPWAALFTALLTGHHGNNGRGVCRGVRGAISALFSAELRPLGTRPRPGPWAVEIISPRCFVRLATFVLHSE